MRADGQHLSGLAQQPPDSNSIRPATSGGESPASKCPDRGPGSEPEDQFQTRLLEEMHKQLRAASRVIQCLKARVEELAVGRSELLETEADLEQRLARALQSEAALLARVAELEAAAARRVASPYEAEALDGATVLAEAQRRAKLSQDQLAKTMALHRKEVEEWTARCRRLEETVRCSERDAAELRASVVNGEARTAALQEEVGSRRAPAHGAGVCNVDLRSVRPFPMMFRVIQLSYTTISTEATNN